MITQVIFKLDKKIKEQAQKKAKARGMTFSNVLKIASYEFVEGAFEPGLRRKEEFKLHIRRMIHREIQEIKDGKNMSPVFHNADDFMNHLEAEIKKSRHKGHK